MATAVPLSAREHVRIALQYNTLSVPLCLLVEQACIVTHLMQVICEALAACLAHYVLILTLIELCQQILKQTKQQQCCCAGLVWQGHVFVCEIADDRSNSCQLAL